jgi:hypothetical protein
MTISQHRDKENKFNPKRRSSQQGYPNIKNTTDNMKLPIQDSNPCLMT